MIKAIHIFDFDGTLVDSSHRYRTDETGQRIDLKFWIDNENLAHLDVPIESTCQLFRAVAQSVAGYALIATARLLCDGFYSVCDLAGINPDSVVARRDRNDHRGGAEIKILHVNRLLNLKQFENVTEIHVYEDNKTYLEKIATHYELKGFNVTRHFFPSNQGH